MAIYNIPGITTSVIDQSYKTPQVSSGRTVLLAGFSKYGDETILEFSNPDDVEKVLGTVNYRKYGLGMKYLLGALTRTNKVLYKRLLPDDATYANVGLDANNNIINVPDIIDKKALDLSDAAVRFPAKARGDGYNTLFMKFSPAYQLEALYANEDGDLDYRFNFLKADIYERSSNGIKAVAPSILFSLIDVDPDTGSPILDMNTGKELFINKKFGSVNDFIDGEITEDYLRTLYDRLSINEITSTPGLERVYLQDIVTNSVYELTVNDSNGFSLVAVQHEGVPERYLKIITTDPTTGNTVEKKYKIYVENTVLKTETYYGDAPAAEYLYINGADAFYKIYINDAEILEKSILHFPRYDLYRTLIDNTFQMNMGSDGKNLIINNTLNFYGEGTATQQNAKQLMMDFYKNTPEIREVMYPKYDFDYLPDWTEDMDVMTAITNLADELGFTMPIVSFKDGANPEEDYNRRVQQFFVNSYNSLLYSGQGNHNHFDEGTGGTIYVPHSYMAMLIHLRIDSEYSITEPAANKNKGVLPDSGVKLSYEVTSADIEKLRGVQINTIISEVDGTYEIDQLTAYKKSSKLSKANIVKPIHRMRKDIPRLLKDFIQVKAIDDKTTEIQKIVSRYMDKYKVSTDNQKDGIFKTIKINSYFIEEEDKLIVSITVNPVGTIETINVPITVE